MEILSIHRQIKLIPSNKMNVISCIVNSTDYSSRDLPTSAGSDPIKLPRGTGEVCKLNHSNFQRRRKDFFIFLLLGAALQTPLCSNGDRLAMTKALVFVNCDYRTLSATISALRKVKGVIETNATNGLYDAVLKVNVSNETELGRVIRNVATVAGVIGIVTSIVMGVK